MKGMAVIVKPTYACNAACDYCEVHKWGDLFKPMDIETYTVLNEKLEKFFKSKADITFYWLGGEPLMMSDEFYGEVLNSDKKSKLNISHAVQSNLIQYTKKDFKNLKKLLKKDNKNILFSTSVDPVSDARKLKNGKNYNEEFLKSIFQLKKESIDYSAVYTVHSGSIGRAKEIYYYFKNLGFKGININAMCDYAGKFNEKEFDMSPKEYGEFLIQMWDIWEKDTFELNITPFTSWKRLKESGKEDMLRCHNNGRCDSSLCAMGPNGDIYTCDRAMQAKQIPLGNIKTNTIEEMFIKKVHTKRIEVLKNSDCNQCEWWSYCKGGCPYESKGEYEGRFEKTFWCEGYKMLFSHIKGTSKNLDSS